MDKKKNNDQFPYLPIFMCIGLSIGVAIGAAMDNIGVGMCIGCSIGVGLGSALDAANRSKNQVNKDEDSNNQ